MLEVSKNIIQSTLFENSSCNAFKLLLYSSMLLMFKNLLGSNVSVKSFVAKNEKS